MKRILLFAVLAAACCSAQTVYQVGPGGGGNNTISFTDTPVSNGYEFSFETVGISNGQPFLSPGWFYYGPTSGGGVNGVCKAVSFKGYPSPVPSYQFFYFTMNLTCPGFDASFNMRGFRGRYGVFSYFNTGGTLTVE